MVPTGIANEFHECVLLGKLRPYLAKAWRANINRLCSTELVVLEPHALAQFLLHSLLADGFVGLVDSSYGSKCPGLVGILLETAGSQFHLPKSNMPSPISLIVKQAGSVADRRNRH